jgi:asparagine synthase (glutamine-hydrolysing)
MMKKFIAATGNDTVTNHFNILSLGFKKQELERLMAHGSGIDVNAILSQYIRNPGDTKDTLKIARYLDKNISLEGDMLVKVERASMLCSLECRAPFLDHRLMEFSFTVPSSYLIRGNNKKRILKDAFKDLVPERYFNAPKSGFEIPIASWLRNELKNSLTTTLSGENLNRHGFFNAGYIGRLIAEHLSGKSDHSFKLWTLYCFQKWFEAWFIE